MSKKYFQGESGFAILIGKSLKLKPVMQKLLPYKLSLFVETENGVISGIVRLKLVSNDINTFNQIYNTISKDKNVKPILEKPNNQALFTIDSFKFRLYKSGGRLTNIIDNDGNSNTNKTPSTAQQEDAIRFMLEYGSIPSKETINKAIKFEFDKSWHDSFVKTFNAINTVIPNLNLYNFYRDSDKRKIDFLNKITDEKILPDSKDNWNPADIWAVKKSSENILQSNINILYNELKTKKVGIENLNLFLEKVFNSKDLYGISLKKVSNPKATIIKVKVNADLVDNIEYTKISNKFEYNVENSYFDILPVFKSYDNTINYRFRFRPKAASGQLKTYGEGQTQDAKTFDGAISSDVINALFPNIKNWVSYASTVLPTVNSVYDTLISQKEDIQFAKFIKANKFNLVNVNGIDEKQPDEYKIRRAAVLLYYIWSFESELNKKVLFKKMYMSAKKLNDFSSIHYKVY